MTLSREKRRELMLQVLYSMDMTGSRQISEAEVERLLMGKDPSKNPLKTVLTPTSTLSPQEFSSIKERSRQILDVMDTLDEWMASAAQEYTLERISRVEKNILRLILFELAFEKKIPHKVGMKEAVRLARKFGTKEGGAFVNGVLDHIYHHQLNPTSPSEGSIDFDPSPPNAPSQEESSQEEPSQEEPSQEESSQEESLKSDL